MSYQPDPFLQLKAKLAESAEEVREERRARRRDWWPPAWLERWPGLFIPMVLVPWIVVIGVLATHGPMFKVTVIGTWLLVCLVRYVRTESKRA